jgi:hypothetical protein
MHHDDLPAMSVDERLDEVASLLAAGFLRLKRRTGCLPPTARSSPNSAPDPATSKSAESSKISAELPCHFSENSAPCAPRQRGLRCET